MFVHIRRDLCPFELSTKVRLARVDGDEIRVQREDAFDVRVE